LISHFDLAGLIIFSESVVSILDHWYFPAMSVIFLHFVVYIQHHSIQKTSLTHFSSVFRSIKMSTPISIIQWHSNGALSFLDFSKYICFYFKNRFVIGLLLARLEIEMWRIITIIELARLGLPGVKMVIFYKSKKKLHLMLSKLLLNICDKLIKKQFLSELLLRSLDNSTLPIACFFISKSL